MHTHAAKEVTDCKSIISDKYRVKETTTTVTKYKESGRFPTGKQLRTGSRQTTLTRESTDPYLPSLEIANPPQYFTEIFQPGQWEYELKGSYLVYDYEDADGDFARARFRAPREFGKTVKKTLKDTGNPPRESNGRCINSAEWTQTEEIEIYRVQ
jgi:hypothetical protein